MKKILVLTETFHINDLEKEILLIGNWCISEKNEKYLRKLNYSVCKSHIETNSDIKKNNKKCAGASFPNPL